MSPDKNQTVAIVKGGHRRGGLLLVGAVGVIAFGLAALLIVSIALPNLFGTTVREQPNAVVLARLQDMARFDAATGRFQTVGRSGDRREPATGLAEGRAQGSGRRR